MLGKISPQEAQKLISLNKATLVDIRSPAEFAQMSIDGALLAPLSVVELQNITIQDDNEIIFYCRSGKRTELAADKLEKIIPHARILDGGIMAWQRENLPIRKGKTQSIPLERQILIAAGSMVLVGFMGSFAWPPFIYLSGFVGAGLVFAGVSGICALGLLLAKMPWNKE